MQSAWSLPMKRILATTCGPMLLSLLLLGACASHNHTELATLEAGQQETHKEIIAVRAQLEALNIRLANMDNMVPVHPRHTGRNSPSEIDAKLLADNIRVTGELSREISRSFADALLENPATYMRGARLVPSIKSGKANGFKLYAIRPNSLYARLGLLNGDTVQAINGKALTTPETALESYSEIKTASSLSVALTRRGQEEMLSISIVD